MSLLAPARAIGRTFDYLHVEADSGASSGGHAAIRFGDDTYHFVNADPGIVRAARERSDEFDFAYRAYDNRGIDVTRVDVSDHTYERLRAAFARRVLAQDAQLDVLDSARSDEALLKLLETRSACERSEHAPVESPLALKGAGYFYGGGGDRSASALPPPSAWVSTLEHVGISTMTDLRADVGRVLGHDWIKRQSAQLDRDIAALRYTCVSPPRFEPNRIPSSGTEFARRYRDLLLARLALDVLGNTRAPVPEAFRTSLHPAFALSAPEIQGIRSRAERTRGAIPKLLTSSRSDRGFPLLIAMARVVAMDTSVALGRLVVLDSFENDGDSILPARLSGNERAAVAVLDEKRTDFEEAKRAVATTAPGNEMAWTRLELVANFYLELERGLTTGAPIRVDPAPVPSRAAALDPVWPLPAADQATLAGWYACARDVTDGVRVEVRRLYGYDLISRNCVTEIFTTIDGAFTERAGADEPVVAEQRALGGHVDGERGLNFIPFVSAAAVNDTYRVAERRHLPSYRHYWLARMLEEDGSIGTRLRESNTLTSRLYQGDGSDVFLFFTDDEPVLRPVLGATNVIVGTGAAAAGLFTLAFDHGELALGGLRGVLFSIPELGFVNIRKGSNAIVPRDWTERPPFDAGSPTAELTARAPTH